MSATSACPVKWNTFADMNSMAMLTSPARPMATITSILLKLHDPPGLLRACGDNAAAGQVRVQVDHVRHDGGADDPHRQQHRVVTRQAGHHAVVEDLGPVRPRQDRLDHVAPGDHRGTRADEDLELAEALALHRQDDEDGHSR